VKFARRQPAETADAPADQPPPPPTPPRGAPVAAFAGVLDGRSLWLAIEARPGSLALRDAASDDVVSLSGDLVEDQPDYRSTRVDLAGLPAAGLPSAGRGEVAYDVVLVPSGGRSPKPVWTPPLPPAVAPVVDGARWELRRGDEGCLRLVRTAVPPAAELTAIGTVDDGIRATTAPGGELALVGDSGGQVASFPDGLITAGALVGVAAQSSMVTAGGLPVRRRDNDLTDPGRAVPLPELYAVEPGLEDRVRLRLRWSGDGLLTARILDPEADQ
jgi:hypothetical protein